MYCDGCNCLSCMNTPANADAVQRAVVATLERNPKAFINKIQYTGRVNLVRSSPVPPSSVVSAESLL